ncbi:ammonium transporter, Amt family [Paenibacillus sp. UNCCL117]|uniref:ammonium transporter n=1 Tax=unclassified Paenibacillus TaxID=185978 RepID=UPI000885F691|nr:MULTISPECIES: ammonium transporter [unclassified Paenibacillus]SDE23721.1 ammonium transporter [Paenibacillus sp. cl123]SFW42508.1 ammonium transporter, Amt family [Paenibacillus sp. UNCCL117]
MELGLNAIWVMLGAILVIFMQSGFVMLEAGSTRMKNAGHIAGKTIVALGIVTLVFWAVGYALIFGSQGNSLIGWGDYFGFDVKDVPEGSTVAPTVMFIFQLAFAAISMAVAFGGFAERAKLSAYLIFAILFSVIVYPVIAHWIWGGGWLAEHGKQDFAGSTVVHLTGAMAALAATLLLKPRLGKYNKNGTPNAMPGHNQVFTTLGVMLLWVGWFGFNAGSTIAVGDGSFFGFVAINTQLAAAAGAVAAFLIAWSVNGKADIGVMLNGALAGLVAITASCAFVESWAAIVIGLIAGFVVFGSMRMFEKLRVDDPIYALSAHGTAGVWGTLSTGIFATPELAEKVGVGKAGLLYGGGFEQLGVQLMGVVVCGAFAFIASYIILAIMKAVMGLRVTEEEETIGLDLSEHGTYGYPEQLKAAQAEARGLGSVQQSL